MDNFYLRRRSFIKIFSLSLLCSVKSISQFAGFNSTSKELLAYIGTFTNGKSEGIYIYRMDIKTGDLHFVKTVKATSPAFLAIHPNDKFLYAVNEVKKFKGKPGGAVSAFMIDSKTGDLTFINQQPSFGGSPCYLSIDKSGKYVFVANYGGGNLSVFPVQKDGSLGDATDIVQHNGSGVNKERQEGPHAHSINPDPAGNYAFAADLGIDKMMIYKPDQKTGKLIPNHTPWVKTRDGAGPRHFTFHPNGKFAFLINELDNSIISYSYDAKNGVLDEIQTVSTLPQDFSGQSSCADIHVSPDGRFVYGSNRGHDSIVIFAIDEKTGKLTLVGFEPTLGHTPRNFALDPTGTYLLAANQKSDNIVVFKIDRQTGKLEPTGQSINVPNPVCVKFYAKQ